MVGRGGAWLVVVVVVVVGWTRRRRRIGGAGVVGVVGVGVRERCRSTWQ